jgi:2-polyprenyl-3-methyl-5-hydroxy-6-metoxy-1,4-benzoquinol methylase
VSQHPQPLFEDLRKRYGDGYFSYELDNDENFFRLMVLGLADIGFFSLPLQSFNNRRFLDIGCATGMLLSHMQKLGWDSLGVEICRESAEYGIKNRGVKIRIGALEELALPDASFSVIHFSHLIEHVPDPRAFLTHVRRLLTPEGMAVITTPNVDGFQARLFRENWRSAIADHLTLFSKNTIARMLRETGFCILRTVTWGGLAKGTAPAVLKRPADYLAKRFGFGDVVLLQVTKNAVGTRNLAAVKPAVKPAAKPAAKRVQG